MGSYLDWDQLRGKERLQRQRARWVVSVTILLLLVLLGTAVNFWWDAREQRTQAEFQRDKARTQLLLMQARRIQKEAQWPEEIELAGGLALESLWLAQKTNLAEEVGAVEAARDTLARLPLVTLVHGGGGVTSLVVLADGRLASGSDDGTIKLWPTEGRGEPMTLVYSGGGVTSLEATSGESKVILSPTLLDTVLLSRLLSESTRASLFIKYRKEIHRRRQRHMSCFLSGVNRYIA